MRKATCPTSTRNAISPRRAPSPTAPTSTRGSATGSLRRSDVNGKLAWKRHLGKEYSRFDLDWGHASSPVLYRDRLILLCYHKSSSYLLALDKRTGKELWKVDRGQDLKSYSTPPGDRNPAGRCELIVNSSENMEAFDPMTGKSLWKYVEPTRFAVPMPVYHDGVLYVSRGYPQRAIHGAAGRPAR